MQTWEDVTYRLFKGIISLDLTLYFTDLRETDPSNDLKSWRREEKKKKQCFFLSRVPAMLCRGKTGRVFQEKRNTPDRRFKEGGRRGKQMPCIKVGYLFSPRKRQTDNKSIFQPNFNCHLKPLQLCSIFLKPERVHVAPQKTAWQAHLAQREALRRDFSFFKKKKKNSKAAQEFAQAKHNSGLK